MKAFLFFSLVSFNLFSAVIINDGHANKIWKSIEIISKFENESIIQKKQDKEYFYIDQVACVFENYNACSFFYTSPNERKMVVAMEGTSILMQELMLAGIEVDEDNARMDATFITCEKLNSQIECSIE